jgi:hypothetical protein
MLVEVVILKGERKSNFWEGLGLIIETVILSHFLF